MSVYIRRMVKFPSKELFRNYEEIQPHKYIAGQMNVEPSISITASAFLSGRVYIQCMQHMYLMP